MAWCRTIVWTQRTELITGSQSALLMIQLKTTAKPHHRPPRANTRLYLSLSQRIDFLIAHPCAAYTSKFDF